MKAKVLNAFLTAAASSMSKELQSPIKRTGLFLDPAEHVTDDVSVYLSIVGKIRGLVLLGMSLETARVLASNMVGESQYEELSEMGLSALAELGNLIAGGACVELEKIGLEADITPPTLMIGAEPKISTLGVSRWVIPLATQCGPVNLHIALDIPNQ